jgi:anthranilate synthase component 1
MQKSKSKVKPQDSPKFIFHTLQEEWLADTETPVSLYLKLQSKYSCLLESVEGEERLARFSYIGLEPFAIFSATIDSKQQGEFKLKILDKKFSALKSLVKSEVSPKEAIAKLLSAVSNHAEQTAITTSGAFGYVGYDAVRFVEKIPLPKKKTLQNCLMCS